MKKKNLLACALVMPLVANAQFLVEQSGNAAVGFEYSTTQPLLSKFSINHRGVNNTLAYFNGAGYKTGLYVFCSGSTPTGGRTGISSNIQITNGGNNWGMKSEAMGPSELSSGKVYGLQSNAGRGQSGYTYGVSAAIYPLSNGAGLYASGGNNPDGVYMDQKYAAYFDGKVKIAGSLTVTEGVTSSDLRLKENIRPLEGRGLDNIMDMNVVQYNLKQIELDMEDTITHYLYEKDSPVLTNTHFGLIAQELQTIYPNLIREDGNGYLAVNYTELIPVLIKSIQELKLELDELKTEKSVPITRGDLSMSSEQIASQTLLLQNNPNPFTESTTIECSVSNDVQSASLYIYDMTGAQIDVHPITARGDVSVKIAGSSLDAGIYMYSLIADGQVIDTKRMILTK
ncbi:MAG: tail fiber domain-containing protein [Bacteroidaceae bacterium]|nr:tail fiber domain-containing protein [Bacteroidaceae bacterium]